MTEHEAATHHHELTGQKRESLAPPIPPAATGRLEDRQVINRMPHKTRTGTSRHDLPERHEP
jgi:hypothetical protein